MGLGWEFVSRINGRADHVFKLTEEESVAMADVVERFLEERGRQRMQEEGKDFANGKPVYSEDGKLC